MSKNSPVQRDGIELPVSIVVFVEINSLRALTTTTTTAQLEQTRFFKMQAKTTMFNSMNKEPSTTN